MGYYMRYFITDKKIINLKEILDYLQSIDKHYTIRIEDESGNSVVLMYKNEPYGEIELNFREDEIFETEQIEFFKFLEDVKQGKVRKIKKYLNKSTSVLVIRVLWQERTCEETLQKIDPIWEWLFKNRKGVLQADGEGFYNSKGLILKLE